MGNDFNILTLTRKILFHLTRWAHKIYVIDPTLDGHDDNNNDECSNLILLLLAKIKY